MTTTSVSARVSFAGRGGLLAYFLGANALTWLFWIPAALVAAMAVTVLTRGTLAAERLVKLRVVDQPAVEGR